MGISGQALLGVISDVFTNISAGWFALMIIEPGLDPTTDINKLTTRIVSGILTLIFAYMFRAEEKQYERL